MLSNVLQVSKRFVQDNSPTILAAMGVAGTVTTAVLSARAGYRAAYILEDEKEERRFLPDPEPLTPRDKFELLWQNYIPPILSTTLTCGAILGSVYVGNRRTAAIAAAYSLSEKAYAEYKEKVAEHLGKTKQRKVNDELAEDRMRKDPVSQHSVIQGTGSVLCYETYSGRYFYSDMESLRRAENDINKQILNNYYASLSDLYDRLLLHHTAVSDDVGWNSDQLLEMSFSTTMSDDDRPCIVVTFDVSPIRGYYRIH